jgi:hypothetical protein
MNHYKVNIMLSKHNISRLIFVISLFIITVVIKVMTEEPKEAPKAREIPGINVPDQFPKGCVSCHKNYTETKFDARLSTVFTSWADAVDPKNLAKLQASAPEGVTYKGKHPFKVKAETSIPEDCNKCHGKMKNAPPLFQLLHVIHLTGGSENNYMTAFHGECTHCHKFDAKTGIWTIVNAKESD